MSEIQNNKADSDKGSEEFTRYVLNTEFRERVRAKAIAGDEYWLAFLAKYCHVRIYTPEEVAEINTLGGVDLSASNLLTGGK